MARAWEQWTPDYTRREADVSGIGIVETWTELVEVALPLVTFRHTFRFEVGSESLTSLSTLRFRSRLEIEADLFDAGFRVEEFRDAPDRPGKEHVFIARRRTDDESGISRSSLRGALRGGLKLSIKQPGRRLRILNKRHRWPSAKVVLGNRLVDLHFTYLRVSVL